LSWVYLNCGSGAAALVRPTVSTLPPVGLWLKFRVLFSLLFRFRLISMSEGKLQQHILRLARMSDRLYDRPHGSRRGLLHNKYSLTYLPLSVVSVTRKVKNFRGGVVNLVPIRIGLRTWVQLLVMSLSTGYY